MKAHDGLRKLATFPFHVATWRGADGYPVNVAVQARVDADAGTATFEIPAGIDAPRAEVSITGSHIRPLPNFGYDERRHVTVWGDAASQGGAMTIRAKDAWGWDEAEIPFFEYAERSVPRSHRYFKGLSDRLGRGVGPRLDPFWLTLRATRLPFLSATLVSVLLGILAAAVDGTFDLPAALLTVVAAAFVHLGLNVANDVFDTLSGADDVNMNPTKYSGGSRVIQYGLVSMRRMALLSALFYGIAIAIGFVLLAFRGSTALLVIGLLGVFISVFYTAPPFRFVYHGLGEIAVALGFGPLLVLGAYVVQTGGAVSPGALLISIPLAILVALILYVNEIPDRRADAAAGKRTLVTRLAPETVLRGYAVAIGVAFLSVAVGVALGLVPVPALLVFVAVPLAMKVHAGIRASYDSPYQLMATMGQNIQLHLVVGGLLLAAYAATLIVALLFPSLRLFL